MFSFLMAFLIIKFFSIKETILFIATFLFFSSLPDIDEYHSHIGRKFKPLSFLLNIFFGHRTIFHSVFVPLSFFALFYLLNQPLLAIASSLGYLSHIFLDAFTHSGIKPFYPLNLQIKGPIQTGSLQEFVIFMVLLMFDSYLVINWIF